MDLILFTAVPARQVARVLVRAPALAEAELDVQQRTSTEPGYRQISLIKYCIAKYSNRILYIKVLKPSYIEDFRTL